MKKLGIVFLTLLQLSFTNKEDLSTYVKELKKSESTSQYIELAKKFGSLESSIDQEWYSDYYAAYSYALSAFANEEFSNIDEALDLAQMHIEKAQQLSPENDEILCVASMIYSARIMVNPQERGYEFGQKSGSMLEKALLINEDNPRALFLIGQSKMYMPVSYGGGCENAKPILEKALIKYDSFEKSDLNAPDWGKEEAKALLKKCS